MPGYDMISLPLAKIVARFSQELQAVVAQPPPPELHITLPLAEIVEQLSRGAVKVPFGIIRHATPAGYLAETANFDPLPVTLPLEEIIGRLSPAQLPKRSDQRRITVPDTVAAPFGGGATVELAPARPTPAPAPSFAAPQPPAAAATAVPQETPASAPAPVATATIADLLRATPPVAPAAPAPATEPRPETIFFRADHLVLPLGRLVNNWPQGVLQEIAQHQLAGESVELPLSIIETGLKQGRLTFSWKQVRAWIPAAPKSGPELRNDAVMLDLPLRIIAPLFLSQRGAQARQQVKVAESIPNLFGPGTLSHDTSTFKRGNPAAAQNGRPASTAASQEMDIWEAQISPATRAAAALPKLETLASLAAPAPAAPTPGTSFVARTTIDQIFDEPGKANWTATEFVRKTSRLKGVAGTCMFTQDGLLVAEQYPALAGVDTFCALVTQMYNRVFTHAMELRLGGPTRMSFAAEGVTYESYRCGRVYLCVISQPGEKLPQAELLIIADHLIRQSR